MEPVKNLERRRQTRLLEQERKREKLMDSYRQMTEGIKRHCGDKKFPRNGNIHKMLMFSEWLTHPPEDMDASWLFMLCPKGQRCIVQAANGMTKSFTKRGKLLRHFKCDLPGGSSKDSSLTILDCIFSKSDMTFYILDALQWGEIPLVGTDTECRQYWIKSHVEEMPALAEGKFKFVHLQTYTCSDTHLATQLTEFPYFRNNTPAVDGILFFHKEGHYTSGSTPLVGWLKPFMIPEILGPKCSIADEYYKERPDDYDSFQVYMTQFNEKESRRNAKWTEVENVEMCDGSLEETEIGEAEMVEADDEEIMEHLND